MAYTTGDIQAALYRFEQVLATLSEEQQTLACQALHNLVCVIARQRLVKIDVAGLRPLPSAAITEATNISEIIGENFGGAYPVPWAREAGEALEATLIPCVTKQG